MSTLFDIEDIGLDQSSNNRENFTEAVVARVKNSNNLINNIVETESFVPGLQTVYIETWGCSHNSSDSEYMAGLLAKYGFTVHLQGCCGNKVNENSEIINKKVQHKQSESDHKMNADLWLLNSCTVKNPAEDHFRNMIAEARKYNKKLVVAGCVPQGQPKAPYLKGVSVIGVQQIDRVVEVVEETLKGNSVQLYGKKRVDGRRLGGASLNLPKIRKNPRIEILPVNSGCLNACTYCKTKHARGDLGSYPVSEIIDRVKQAFEEGCVEIWLTSEDLGAYGRDIGTSLPDLLEKMVDHIPEGCMLRMGMTNPPYILEHLTRISVILQHPRVYSFIHVPVQSGSNNVLGEMRREYTREDFCHVVDTLYRAIGPDKVTIATDIICGFPTETDEDFEDTYRLVDRYRFSVLFTNQFFPRPGTPAAKMERCATSMEVKKRTKRVHELFQSYEPYRDRIGDEMNVLVTEESADGDYYVGHTKSYEQVLLAKEARWMGRVVRVRVSGASKHSMMASVISESVRDVSESPVVAGCGQTAAATLSASMLSRIVGVLCLALVLFKMVSLCSSLFALSK